MEDLTNPLVVGGQEIRTEGRLISGREIAFGIGYKSPDGILKHLGGEKIRGRRGMPVRAGTPEEIIRAIDLSSYGTQAHKNAVREWASQNTPASRPHQQETSERSPVDTEGLEAMIALFEGSELRVVDDDPITVVLADIARPLGYTTANLSRSIKDKYKGLHYVKTPGGSQKMLTTTRPGLSALLATLNPQDPQKAEKVERFQDWLYEDLLESYYEGETINARPEPEPEVNDVIAREIRRYGGLLEKQGDRIDRFIGLQQNNEVRAPEEPFTGYHMGEHYDNVSLLKQEIADTIKDLVEDDKNTYTYGDIRPQAYRYLEKTEHWMSSKTIDQVRRRGESKINAIARHHTSENPLLLYVLDYLRTKRINA